MSSTTIPPRSALSVHLHPAQTLRISNPSGTQVVDLWAFASRGQPSSSSSSSSPSSSTRDTFSFKHLSMIHTRSALRKLTLAVDDVLRDNEREDMLTVLEDTCGGVHCMLFAACDVHRYRQLGAAGHASCGDNLKAELRRVTSLSQTPKQGTLGVALASAAQAAGEGWLPDPVNLFMNVPVTALEDGKGGQLRLAPPLCPKGGYVVLRAEADCVVVMSACPMDLAAAGAYENVGAEFEILNCSE